MARSTLTAMAFALAISSFGFNSTAHAEDACAGQSWPNWSEACIEQMVEKIANTVDDTVDAPEPSDKRPLSGVKLKRK